MKRKGISLVSLAVIVVIMLILLTTISVSITYSISNAKKMTFAKEIYNIQNIVTEYIQKENVLPVSETTIQIEPSDTEQFEGENITDGKIVLNVINLDEIEIKNTNYGNMKIGNTDSEKAKDIYVVSQTTGRVYYIAGFKASDKVYYTLSDELLNMIDKKQNLLIAEKNIIFEPTHIGWTNESVRVMVSVPNEYELTSIDIDNANIQYTSTTDEKGVYYNINTSDVLENYTITVNYVKNGVSGNVSYKTKLDTTKPVILIESNDVNSKYINGVVATDTESGIKYLKYADDWVNEDNLAEYIKEYGKNINKSRIKKKTEGEYTIYAEDKAGNYSVICYDMNYPKVDLSSSPVNIAITKELSLTNQTNQTLTFNASGVTRSKIADVKEIVFEVKNGNNVTTYTKEVDVNGNASISYTFDFGLSYINVYAVDTLGRKSEPVKYDFKIATVTMTGTQSDTALDIELTAPANSYISSYSFTTTNEGWIYLDIYVDDVRVAGDRARELYGRSTTDKGTVGANSVRYMASTPDRATIINCDYTVTYKPLE